jgi:hypothetical protein
MAISGTGIAFILVNAIALLMLPRRWAPLPLLVGTCYMTLGQGIELGPFHLFAIRLLIAVGLVRVITRGERLVGELNGLDRIMMMWASWALISSIFHQDPSGVLVYRLGLVYNACGIYFLFRIFCQSLEDAIILCRITAILLAPLSVLMVLEKLTGYNTFSVLGGVSEMSEIRAGSIRAQGPFAHSILAGTVGAVCLPLMVGLWGQHRRTALTGIVACLLMIITSNSSGPIMSAAFAIGALFLWAWRGQMRLLRWLAVLSYIGLNLIMKAPAYFLIARLDLTGSSTGWHRAALIDAAVEHFSEWWLAGTDFTRHWIPYGVGWSENHIDITNHYIQMGVWGGMPLMFLFIAILAKGFSIVGERMQQMNDIPSETGFMIWTLGAALFSHAATFISVSYFDQSFVFIYLTLALISATRSKAFAVGTMRRQAICRGPCAAESACGRG